MILAAVRERRLRGFEMDYEVLYDPR
jgi:hypothetical protein